jgi:hypothetical protein
MLVSGAFRWRHVGVKLRSRLKIVGILNGCGPKGGPKGGWLASVLPSRILGLHIEEFCDWHDFNYTIGGKEADRVKADWQFYEATYAQAIALTESSCKRWLRPLYTFVAWALYRAVWLDGRRHFHYGDPRSEEDVMLLLSAAERELGIAA